jgi:cysteine desulfurase
MKPVYLDYNATAPVRPEIIGLMTEVMAHPGNASSVHAAGRAARKYVEDAREQVAALVGVKPASVIFNSGATEGNNTVLNAYTGQRVLISAIEHPSVLNILPETEKIPVTREGVIDLTALRAMIAKGPKPALISVMMVNSETGVIQPARDIAAIAHEVGALFHTDAVQAAGRIPVNLADIGADYLTLSAHKMAGPQGVGALIVREGLTPPRFMKGGSQETNHRAGTQNVAGIAGMGLAARLAAEHLPHYTDIQKLRDMMEAEIRALAKDVVIFGTNAPRVGNTSDISLPGVEAQTQLMALDLAGICVSSGSACSSGSFKPSHVLLAMTGDEGLARSALRISLGYATTTADITHFLQAWEKMYRKTTGG